MTGATLMAVSVARAASLGTVAASDLSCRAPEPSLQMTVAPSAVAGALPPQRVRDATGTPVAPPAGPQSRFRLNGQKYASPVGSRSEAGVAMSLGSHLSLQLNYARTAQVPMMGYSSDNGILARLRFAF